jgi:hypothetical protein
MPSSSAWDQIESEAIESEAMKVKRHGAAEMRSGGQI